MSYQEYHENGNLKIWSDDELRLYHTYGEDGVEILPPRDFTPEENIVADAYAEQAALEAAEALLKKNVRSIINEVKAERDALDADFIDPNTGQPATNQVINNSPAKYIKAVKKFDERVSRALIDVAKLLTN